MFQLFPVLAMLDRVGQLLVKLQGAISTAGIPVGTFDLPRIVVVGGQSSGKSSVLEALVGKDFLPRGTGIVTRRPLQLLLCRLAAGEKEYAEFGHLPGTKFTDFFEVRKEIEVETARVCSGETVISDDPITLKVHSPHVLDLCLVDLPGLTKMPLPSQPRDIHERLKDLVLSHIQQDNAIILAVTPAASDLAVSDSLSLAGEVDTTYSRTLGVLTKLDLMDRGTNAVSVLAGQVFPLAHGYVGVVCRSQQDSDAGRSMKDGLDAEMRYFRSMPVYRHMSDRVGVSSLAKKLSQMLLKRVAAQLPSLKKKVHTLMEDHRKSECEAELSEIGEDDSHCPSEEAQSRVLLDVFTKFSRAFSDALEGRLPLMLPMLGAGSGRGAEGQLRLSGGARICHIFRESFGRKVEGFDPFHGLSDTEILLTIKNGTGPRMAIFVPELAFEALVKKQIAKLRASALQCVDMVAGELEQLLCQCELPEMRRYSGLGERMDIVTKKLLNRCLAPTREKVDSIIQCELTYINTGHPDFIGGSMAIAKVHSRDTPAEAAQLASPVALALPQQQQQSAHQFIPPPPPLDTSCLSPAPRGIGASLAFHPMPHGVDPQFSPTHTGERVLGMSKSAAQLPRRTANTPYGLQPLEPTPAPPPIAQSPPRQQPQNVPRSIAEEFEGVTRQDEFGGLRLDGVASQYCYDKESANI